MLYPSIEVYASQSRVSRHPHFGHRHCPIRKLQFCKDLHDLRKNVSFFDTVWNINLTLLMNAAAMLCR